MKQLTVTDPMWHIELWVWPIWDTDERDASGKRIGKIIKLGRWMAKGTVESAQEAEEAVQLAARRNMLARARWSGEREEGALTGMRAGPTGFSKWTGSGGAFG